MNQKELDDIIERHQHWLNEDCKGWEKMKADLSRKDLSSADLSEADMYRADLYGADLSGANLRGANLSHANLNGAYLRDADLSGAYLSYTDMYGADLSGAKLTGANLSGTNLSSTNLSGADLSHANLREANLANAVLDDGTALVEVIYDEATAFFKPCCPEKGSFVAFKKACMYSNDGNKVIVRLQVPDKAQRSSATSRKCRVSEAKVVSITSLDGKKSFKKAKAFYDYTFVYEVGKTVKANDFEPCRWKECAPGIHCFITRDEAVNY